MICGKCGKRIDDDSVFCEFCGAKAESAQPKKAYEPGQNIRYVYCAHCGARIEDASIFCDQCGEPLEMQESSDKHTEKNNPESNDSFNYTYEKYDGSGHSPINVTRVVAVVLLVCICCTLIASVIATVDQHRNLSYNPITTTATTPATTTIVTTTTEETALMTETLPPERYFAINEYGVFIMDQSLFGLNYKQAKAKINGYLPTPVEWPYDAPGLTVSWLDNYYGINVGLFFQDGLLQKCSFSPEGLQWNESIWKHAKEAYGHGGETYYINHGIIYLDNSTYTIEAYTYTNTNNEIRYVLRQSVYSDNFVT